MKIQVIPERVVERVPDKVAMGAAVNLRLGPCHLSTYSTASHGYAQVGWRDGARTLMVLCHQVIWVANHGPVPDGMTVDHMCHIKPCIRSDHLRLLTNRDNGRRNRPGLDWPLDGSCVNGHGPEHYKPITGKDGHRKNRCVLCVVEYSRRYGTANPDKVRESRRKYAEANPERLRESQRRSNVKSRERKNAWRRDKRARDTA